MKRHLIFLLPLVALLLACGPREPHFTVEGTLTGAADSVLYLEHLSLSGVVSADSTRLDEGGRFTLEGARPTNPEFYRLRIADRLINFSVDSTEIVTVEAAYPTMSTDYVVKGSADCEDIKTLTLMLRGLQEQVRAVGADRSLTLRERAERAQELVDAYKLQVKRDYILKDPGSAAAYFALFQSVGGTLLFNPVSDWNDVRFFAAVGTAWEQKYPGTQRTQNLHNIALQGMKNSRPNRTPVLDVDSSKVEEVGLINLELRDMGGTIRRLSDLRGKVVLLDFTAYMGPNSQERIMQLRELYDDYAARGLEIYQVSFDRDEHYWKTASESLPWVCVYDPAGLQSVNVRLYQLQTFPAYFLIDRNSQLVARGDQIPDLRKAIEALL